MLQPGLPSCQLFSAVTVHKQNSQYIQHAPMAVRGLGIRIENQAQNEDNVPCLGMEQLLV